jgi:undecaprenyl-diphosphatase
MPGMIVSTWTPERLADAIGAHAFLLLCGLTLFVVALLLAAYAVVRWVVRHRTELWRRLSRLWSRGAAKAAKPVPAARHLTRLTPRKFLALDLALGFVLTLALLAFLGLADEVQERAGLVRFDLALAETLHRHASPRQVWWMLQVTAFGTGLRLTIATLLVFWWLMMHRERLLAWGWLVAVGGGGLCNTLLKEVFKRPRPVLEDPFLHAKFWSFPSGHSMGTFVFSGMLVYLVVVFVPRPGARLAAAALALAWTLLIGYSRMLLGAHYFSDVVAGYAAGSVWLTTCVAGLELVRRRSRLTLSPAAARSGAPGPAR